MFKLKKLSVNIVLTLLFTLMSAPSLAKSIEQKNQFSLGAFYGNTFGASSTYNWKRDIYIDAAITYEFDGLQNINTWGDVLKRENRVFGVSKYDVNWFWGGGVKFRTENDPDAEEYYFVGPRAVAGLSSHIYPMPLEVYAEAAMSLYLMESQSSEFDINFGARYFF